MYKIVYVSLMVTTKQKSTVDSQNIRSRESKHTTSENHQFTKEGSKRRKERKKYKTARKKDDITKSLPINKYSKCK